MRSSHLDRILGKLDDLDNTNLTILVQRLARERLMLETVFNTINEGILVIDSSGVIEYSNQTANSMISLNETDLGHAILWKRMPDLAQSLNINDLSEKFTAITREFYISYPEHRDLRLNLFPLELSREDIHDQRFLVILSDITQDKLTTEERIENEKMSSIVMLAAGVAHELGNPLNSINIHLQLIQRQLEKIQEAQSIKNSVEICTSEVNRLDGIITNFLKAIRPMPLELNDLRLIEVLDEVLALQAHELENLGIKVEVELRDELPIILADRNQIKQVFFNIIKNAIEAIGTKGKLKIKTFSDDEYAYIYFIDSGVGMDPESLGKVFEPFYSKKKEGYGLGMMIVQRILRNHCAKIGIDSRKGVGTKVTLQFPLKSKRTKMLESL